MEKVFNTESAKAVLTLIRYHVEDDPRFAIEAVKIQRQLREQGMEQAADYIAALYNEIPTLEPQ